MNEMKQLPNHEGGTKIFADHTDLSVKKSSHALQYMNNLFVFPVYSLCITTYIIHHAYFNYSHIFELK